MRPGVPHTPNSALTHQPATTSIEGRERQGEINHFCDVHLVRAKRATTNYLGRTMTLRANLGWGLLGGLAFAISGCATPPAPVELPPIVMAPPPPPPVMPAGGYIGMKSATKRPDGKYVTPNLDNTDQAAVWHLRNALNVAALGCDQAGGGVIELYNAWLKTHAAVIDRYYQAYIREWQAPGWWDWQRVYDDNQTRIYNFYAQPAMRSAFCAIAREEVAKVGQVADDDLPAFARAALLRLDRPFVEFYAAYDAWRDYYQPDPPLVVPPPMAQTTEIPVVVPSPSTAGTLSDNDSVAVETETPSADTETSPADTETPPALAPGDAPIPAPLPPR
ncbi:hypothetical protein SPHI_25980 [Sphingomonas jeddahensis]|uniref:Uncharacterized protein n=2 Tax=Sphingomonas jeddahensis TaxID=1915074 RepID=A0A1V2ERG3_9SPHN|nr:hypothetical protein SPHI_25980 [Sphingomonas jeddahensis]